MEQICYILLAVFTIIAIFAVSFMLLDITRDIIKDWKRERRIR